MKNAIFLCDDTARIEYVYGRGAREQIARETRLLPGVTSSLNLNAHVDALREVEVAFSTWGMPTLTPAQLDCLPALRAVFYAAGTVRPFAQPLLDRGITVVSAWAANAVPVAEFTVAQILLANKGCTRNQAEFTSPHAYPHAFRGIGNYGETVCLLGAGQVGRAVIELLRHFRLRVMVWDPFLSAADADALAVRRLPSIVDAFRRGMVVSNHLANLPETEGLLRAEHFALMRRHACFINTGRGATVDEVGLISVLRDRPDLTALLDVTDPDPPAEGSPLYTLRNVRLTTHIAGALNDEVGRLADCVLDEFRSWAAGKPLRYAVTAGMLRTMA